MPTTPHHPSAPGPAGCGSFEPGIYTNLDLLTRQAERARQLQAAERTYLEAGGTHNGVAQAQAALRDAGYHAAAVTLDPLRNQLYAARKASYNTYAEAKRAEAAAFVEACEAQRQQLAKLSQ